MHKKMNWNDRQKKQIQKERKKIKNPFLVQSFRVEEILDESGEVDEDTIIKISFDGILIHMSIANAIKMNRLLGDILEFKR